VCNVDDVIKTKQETVCYFAYWRARDVPSGAEVAIVGCRLALTELRKIKLEFRLRQTLKNFRVRLDGPIATAATLT